MRIKIPVQEVKFGMFVGELDRPWLETPFPFQGFRVQKIEDVERLKRYCDYVYVDIEKSTHRRAPKRDTPELGAFQQIMDKIIKRREQTHLIDEEVIGKVKYEVTTPVERALPKARDVRNEVRKVIDSLYESARTGSSIDTGYAKAVVEELADSVVTNPNAHMLLAQMRSRDEYTAIHSVNVCTLSLAFGRHLGLPENLLRELGLGAMLHDLGKMKIPLEVLNKPERLTSEEFELIKQHPVFGMEMLLDKRESIPPRAVDVAYTHHEQLDGRGYPQGLTGRGIPLFGRIVAIVDFYDAVTSDRAYHDGDSPGSALRHLYEHRSGRFDVSLVERFIQCLSIFPVGSVVECDTGEVGIVIAQNPDRRLRPKLLLVLDAYHGPYMPPKIIDLALFKESDDIMVKRLARPNELGVSVADYLSDFSWLTPPPAESDE